MVRKADGAAMFTSSWHRRTYTAVGKHYEELVLKSRYRISPHRMSRFVEVGSL